MPVDTIVSNPKGMCEKEVRSVLRRLKRYNKEFALIHLMLESQGYTILL